MFWAEPFDLEAARVQCNATWGAVPDALHAQTEWGGRRLGAASNVVFSNGLYDPWHGGGVLQSVSSSVLAVVIPEGAHHLDLMWSHADDPPSVLRAPRYDQALFEGWRHFNPVQTQKTRRGGK